LVITAMFEARNPKYYAWMWKGQPSQIAQSADHPAEPQSKPAGRAKPAIAISPDKIPGAGIAAVPGNQPAPPAADEEADLLNRARKDGWSRLFDQIPADKRESGHDLLYALLRAARSGSPPSEDERRKGNELLPQLDQAWIVYRADALVAIANLTDEEKGGWLTILNTLDRDWSAETYPALKALVAGSRLGPEQLAVLDRLQQRLDQLALEAVQDNTVPNRPVERHAWFRLFEVLGGTEEPVLKKHSLGAVGYVQLLKQPKDYRGKLVTVKGTVELGYRVTPPENVEGIQQYYSFWLRPIGGDDSPIVIYALETPPGFPPVLAKDDQNQKANRLDVEAEFTGYFFKRMAYLSIKDTRTTPLILARGPHYDERWAARAAARPVGELPSPTTALWVLGGTAGFALVVVALIFYATRRPRQVLVFPDEISVPDLRRLEALAGAHPKQVHLQGDNQDAPRPEIPPINP
jgi:hypothetical protein